MQVDIKNNLGLNIGATGNLSPVTCGENVDDTVDTKKEDKYKFTGSITLSDDSTITEKNDYTITHSLNKYTCLALDTALNSNAGKAGFSIQNANDINNKVTMVTQSANTLTVYPEVAYKYYLADASGGVLNNVKSLTVYVMGERARTMKPSSIRGIDMDYVTGAKEVAEGDIISDGTLVGSNASSMSGGKQVMAQGTNITMKADHTIDYRLISYSLDVVDTYGGVNVRNEFSSENIKYQPDKEHEAFVQEFIDNVQVDTYMNINNTEYEMKTNSTTPRVSQGTTTTYLAIEFADGKIDENAKNSVINDIATEYGVSTEQATQIFESAGFEKQLQDMFESNVDSDNGSRNKWYDEESVTLCIRKYITIVDLYQALVQDKIDYGTVNASGIMSNGQTKQQAVDAYFTMSVSLPENFAECNLINANKLFEKQKIKNTDFKVGSSTTADFDSGYGDN